MQEKWKVRSALCRRGGMYSTSVRTILQQQAVLLWNGTLQQVAPQLCTCDTKAPWKDGSSNHVACCVTAKRGPGSAWGHLESCQGGFDHSIPILTKSPEQPLAPPRSLHSLQPSGAAAVGIGRGCKGL